MVRAALIPLLLLLVLAATLVAQDDRAGAQAALRRADALLEAKQYQTALTEYKRAFGLTHKASFDAALGMALAAHGLGAHKDVVDACTDALKLAGGDGANEARVLNLRGTALMAQSQKAGDKRMESALADFRAALAANPRLAAAHFNLGIALLRMNRDEDGKGELRAYLDASPGAPDAPTARQMLEDPRRAREAFAPPFSFTSRDGDVVALDRLKGKTVVLDFWGSWCGPCLQAAPTLARLHEKFADKQVVFLGIARDEEANWSKFLEKNPSPWPQVLDRTETLTRQFSVTGFPTYIVIDNEGIIRARKSGFGQETGNWLDREIQNAMKPR
jgi:thiol-disulfide isomerase/thioredoxin